ncbi:UNVERIFIED_CONTAM: hypothetical protein Slati_3515500 [Sesamum latifolium]|uniref:Uncharacterized protein n=1 Tax=Sesamum latifolium TaxID=2727402 RepID=A0AAW2ULF6_9LAMI
MYSHESWHIWNRGKLHHYCEQRNTFTVFLPHESWGRRLKCDLVDRSGLTLSNMIRLESLRLCEEARQNILKISWNENSIRYLHKNFSYESAMSWTSRSQWPRRKGPRRGTCYVRDGLRTIARHIRYAATKAFFETKMIEGSSVQSHGIKMLYLVEKLKNLKAVLDNNTYIDVNFQSLPPSYDPFITNYNMNEL